MKRYPRKTPKLITFAVTDKVDELEFEVRELLVAIARYMVEEGGDPEAWADDVFVSDESWIGDFLSFEKDVDTLAADLGLFSLKRTDRVFSVALLLRQMKQLQ